MNKKNCIKTTLDKNSFFIDWAIRITLIFYQLSYGIAKLNGGMFSNYTSEILNSKLSDVDLFHLTWYWFSRNHLLTYSIGITQVICSIMLFFNRFVALSILISLPIWVGIILIDIYCVGFWGLTGRVIWYLFLSLYILQKRISFLALFNMIFASRIVPPSISNFKKKIIKTVLFLALITLIEFVIVDLLNHALWFLNR